MYSLLWCVIPRRRANPMIQLSNGAVALLRTMKCITSMTAHNPIVFSLLINPWKVVSIRLTVRRLDWALFTERVFQVWLSKRDQQKSFATSHRHRIRISSKNWITIFTYPFHPPAPLPSLYYLIRCYEVDSTISTLKPRISSCIETHSKSFCRLPEWNCSSESGEKYQILRCCMETYVLESTYDLVCSVW